MRPTQQIPNGEQQMTDTFRTVPAVTTGILVLLFFAAILYVLVSSF